MTHLYLAGYVGSGTDLDPFRPPTDQAWSAIDLRPDPSVREGVCLVRVPEQEPIGDYIGTLDEAPTVPGSRGIENRLGLPRDSLRDKTLRQIIADVLVLWGEDEPGRGRWRSLRPGRDGRLRVFLGGPIWEMAVPAGGAQLNETWGCPDSASISCDLTWGGEDEFFQLVSGEIIRSSDDGPPRFTRAEHDLDSADHEVTLTLGATLRTAGSLDKYSGPVARFDPAAITGYWPRVRWSEDLADCTHDVWKVEAGSFTLLSGELTGIMMSPGDTITIEADGSSITSWVRSGEQTIAITDTSITGHVRAGALTLARHNNNSAPIASWQGTDLGGGGDADASGASTAPASTSSGTATVEASASGASAAPAATGQGTAEAVAAASGGSTAPAAQSTGTASVQDEIDASGGSTAPAATSAGTATVEASAAGSSTAPPATSTGAAQTTVGASGGSVAPAADSTGTAETAVTASGGSLAPAATSTGTAAATVTAAGSSAAPAATSTGTANLGDPQLNAAGASTAPAATSDGTAAATVTAAGGSVAASSTSTGTAELVPLALDASGASTAPAATSAGAGTVTVTAAGGSVAPAATSTGTVLAGALPVPPVTVGFAGATGSVGFAGATGSVGFSDREG